MLRRLSYRLSGGCLALGDPSCIPGLSMRALGRTWCPRQAQDVLGALPETLPGGANPELLSGVPERFVLAQELVGGQQGCSSG